jgi:hypothetical protein
MPREDSDSAPQILRTPADLGALRRVREQIRGSARPVILADRGAPARLDDAARALRDHLSACGTDVVVAGFGGGPIAATDLLMDPRPLGLIAVGPSAGRIALPEYEADHFLEDHATWVIAVSLLVRGAAGFALESAGRLMSAPPSSHGAAWLGRLALSWAPNPGPVAHSCWRSVAAQ